MKEKKSTLIISILIPLLVGGISAMLTRESMQIYSDLIRPTLAPPSFIFPIVWTILFILMGISSYIVYKSDSLLKKPALTVYAIQLIFNFFWTIIFFNMGAYLFAFIWLLMLIALIIAMIFLFYKVRPIAAYLQIPYLLWCIFAAYLNFMIYLLN